MIAFGFGVTLHPLDVKYSEMIRAWRNDYAIWKFCRQNDLINDWDQAAWFKRQAEDPATRMYLIQYGDTPVGVCGLTSIDLLNRRAEFSLYIASQHQGDGLGARALKTLLAHGFRNLGMNSIWGETFDGNPAARIFERLGFVKEGTRREYYFRDGKFIDAHLYSMTHAEWSRAPKGPVLCSM